MRSTCITRRSSRIWEKLQKSWNPGCVQVRCWFTGSLRTSQTGCSSSSSFRSNNRLFTATCWSYDGSCCREWTLSRLKQAEKEENLCFLCRQTVRGNQVPMWEYDRLSKSGDGEAEHPGAEQYPLENLFTSKNIICVLQDLSKFKYMRIEYRISRIYEKKHDLIFASWPL